MDSKGWLKIGDLCYIDEEGLFFVLDKIKELILINNITQGKIHSIYGKESYNLLMLTNNRERYNVGGLINETRLPLDLVREGCEHAYVGTSKECIILPIKEIYTPKTKRGESWMELK